MVSQRWRALVESAEFCNCSQRTSAAILLASSEQDEAWCCRENIEDATDGVGTLASWSRSTIASRLAPVPYPSSKDSKMVLRPHEASTIASIEGQPCCRVSLARPSTSSKLKDDIRDPHTYSTKDSASNQVLDLQAQVPSLPAAEEAAWQDKSYQEEHLWKHVPLISTEPAARVSDHALANRLRAAYEVDARVLCEPMQLGVKITQRRRRSQRHQVEADMWDAPWNGLRRLPPRTALWN